MSGRRVQVNKECYRAKGTRLRNQWTTSSRRSSFLPFVLAIDIVRDSVSLHVGRMEKGVDLGECWCVYLCGLLHSVLYERERALLD